MNKKKINLYLKEWKANKDTSEAATGDVLLKKVFWEIT